MRTAVIFLLALLACAGGWPDAALAYSNLTCTGPIPNGTLYDTNSTCEGVNSLQNVFSGLVCDYQKILDAIMGRVYCGLQYALNAPLRIAITIFIIIFGLQLMTGFAQASLRDFIPRIVKLALIWTFAMYASFGIGIAYNFFIDTGNQGIAWVLSVIPMPTATQPTEFCHILPDNAPFNPERQAFRFMDFLICKSVTGPFTANGAALSGLFAVLSWMIPPLFAMFAYFISKSIAILVRCLFAYLLCIGAIAFMITLSPLFFSFALFRPTYRFFDDWLRFMISFTLQIILMFAGVALWISVVTQLGGFFDGLATMVRPVKEVMVGGAVRGPTDTWGICQHQLILTYWGPTLVCTDIQVGPGEYEPPPIKPSELINHQTFLFFLNTNLMLVCAAVYVFDMLMKMIPRLAKQLAGNAYAPQIAGGADGINFGSLMSLENAGQGASKYSQMFKNLVERR